MPKISVIVPIYNVEIYLRKCIDSIINQTFEDLEIILVNDGSPDGCGAICDEYAGKDSRVRVIHKEHRGVSDARNAGIDIATGEYITFVDGDDYIAVDMCEKLYSALTENKAEISVCNAVSVDENYQPIDSLNSSSSVRDELLNGRDILFKKLTADFNWYWVVVWGKLYKSNLFDALRFPVGKIHEDDFMAHRMFFDRERVASVSERLYYYLRRSDSITGNKTIYNTLYALETFLDRIIYYENKNTEKTEVDKIFHKIEPHLRYVFNEKGLYRNKKYRPLLIEVKKYLTTAEKLYLKYKIPITKRIKLYLHICSPLWLWMVLSYLSDYDYWKNKIKRRRTWKNRAGRKS